MGAFAIAVLLLAFLGIYGLIAYSVGRRSQEIGVRLALGARLRDVVAMLLRENVRVGGAGLASGLVLAAAIFLATWWPARRAAQVEPTIALRHE